MKSFDFPQIFKPIVGNLWDPYSSESLTNLKRLNTMYDIHKSNDITEENIGQNLSSLRKVINLPQPKYEVNNSSNIIEKIEIAFSHQNQSQRRLKNIQKNNFSKQVSTEVHNKSERKTIINDQPNKLADQVKQSIKQLRNGKDGENKRKIITERNKFSINQQKNSRSNQRSMNRKSSILGIKIEDDRQRKQKKKISKIIRTQPNQQNNQFSKEIKRSQKNMTEINEAVKKQDKTQKSSKFQKMKSTRSRGKSIKAQQLLLENNKSRRDTKSRRYLMDEEQFSQKDKMHQTVSFVDSDKELTEKRLFKCKTMTAIKKAFRQKDAKKESLIFNEGEKNKNEEEEFSQKKGKKKKVHFQSRPSIEEIAFNFQFNETILNQLTSQNSSKNNTKKSVQKVTQSKLLHRRRQESDENQIQDECRTSFLQKRRKSKKAPVTRKTKKIDDIYTELNYFHMKKDGVKASENEIEPILNVPKPLISAVERINIEQELQRRQNACKENRMIDFGVKWSKGYELLQR